MCSQEWRTLSYGKGAVPVFEAYFCLVRALRHLWLWPQHIAVIINMLLNGAECIDSVIIIHCIDFRIQYSSIVYVNSRCGAEYTDEEHTRLRKYMFPIKEYSLDNSRIHAFIWAKPNCCFHLGILLCRYSENKCASTWHKTWCQFKE